ncbi:unnamed protein product, partial [Laminaria digitata]
GSRLFLCRGTARGEHAETQEESGDAVQIPPESRIPHLPRGNKRGYLDRGWGYPRRYYHMIMFDRNCFWELTGGCFMSIHISPHLHTKDRARGHKKRCSTAVDTYLLSS